MDKWEPDCKFECNDCGYFDTSIPHDSCSESDCCTRRVGDTFPKPEDIPNIKICVFGLWHLGLVTAGCMADKRFDVVGLDRNKIEVKKLNSGILPIEEPHLNELILKGIKNKRLSFTENTYEALRGAKILWITFDTPVDDNDNADVEYVKYQIRSLYPYIEDETTILISSQLPAGTTSELEQEFKKEYPYKVVYFAYSPENLRLGKAIDVFNNPDRIIVGMNNIPEKNTLDKLFSYFESDIVWMSIESAEMVKHALNSFLATEIAFINEIAIICEKTGANIRDVELGLKSESRIGEKAYLKAGSAFAGGTLARDVQFLINIEQTPLLSSVIESNDNHKLWAFYKLREIFGLNLEGKTIAVLGLTYKPNTNTLRRSSSIELCKLLIDIDANIKTHDPSLTELPEKYKNFNLCSTIAEATENVDAIVIATEWEVYKNLGDIANLSCPIIIDANGFLYKTLNNNKEIAYYTVGKGV